MKIDTFTKNYNIRGRLLSHPNFFIIIIIIIYSSTKELILKYSISALKDLNVEFLLEFVQKEDMENLL